MNNYPKHKLKATLCHLFFVMVFLELVCNLGKYYYL